MGSKAGKGIIWETIKRGRNLKRAEGKTPNLIERGSGGFREKREIASLDKEESSRDKLRTRRLKEKKGKLVKS